MADYNEADIRAQLGAATLTKGEAYANDDRVKALTAQTEGSVLVLRGEVAGSRRYTSVVRVRQVHHRVVFESHCSCPLGGDCKHVAALLLSHLAGSRPDAARRLNEAQRMRQATLIEMWLLQLSQGAKRPPKVGDEVRVLLSRQSYRSWGSPWDLTLMKSTRHKNGQGISFKVLRSPDFNALRSSYPHLAPLLTAFAGEQRSQSGYGGTLQLQGVGGLVVLHGAISAGACHLDDIDSPPLTLGDSRRVTPRWQENDDGSQQLVVGEPHWLLLPVEPLHAVDPLSGSCFMVDSGLPGLTSAALAKAPLIPQELADKVAETVASHLPRLPLPRSRMAEARRDLLPQPLLRIGNLDPSQPHLEGITLWFRYGQQLVSSDDHSPHLPQPDGSLVLRHPELEQDYRDQLERELNTIILPGSSRDRPLHGFGNVDLNRWLDWRINRLPAFVEAGWQWEQSGELLELVDDPAIDAELQETRQGGWFDLALGIDIDGERHELLPMLLAAIQAGSLTADQHYLLNLPRRDGRRQIVRIPAARLTTIVTTLQELMEGRSKASKKLSLTSLNVWSLVQGDGLSWRAPKALDGYLQQLRQLDQLPPVTTPPGFTATLRHYQCQGLARLQFWRQANLNGILADDMGLGKTLQTLAHILTEKQAGRLTAPALVVTPTSVVGNWRAEARRFAPALKLLVLHGSDRHGEFERLDDADLVITSYPLLVRDLQRYAKPPFHLLVLDEAQVIKNRRTQVAEAVRLIKARHRLCLSGTPLENNLGELWSLFDFLMPGLLGEQQRFARLYRVPIEKAGDTERAAQLARRVAPFLLRRTKAEVVAELPAKTEILRSIDLEGAQRDLYETVRVAVTREVQSAIASRGAQRNQILVLDALLKLRQVCCDPRLVKLDAARQVSDSAKLDHLAELLPGLVAEGRRVLLFSQFVEMLGLIGELADELAIPYLKLTGSSRNREALVNKFQSGAVPLFLISLKAGGVGLNLTAADTVIHYDPWWNPAVENQATDRAHRIGQDKPVFVYKLVTSGTVEEQILAMQGRKQALADGIHGATNQLSSLSDEDIEALLRPLGMAD